MRVKIRAIFGKARTGVVVGFIIDERFECSGVFHRHDLLEDLGEILKIAQLEGIFHFDFEGEIFRFEKVGGIFR